MFDLRYHVASLAAVFVALIVGILVGVGLAGSGVTKEADLKVAREERDSARRDAAARAAQLKQLGASADTLQNAFQQAYPEVMRGLLKGKRVAVLYVGPVDGGVSQAIETTLLDAGAAPPVRVLSLSVPVDAKTLDSALAEAGPQYTKYVGDDKLGSLGSALGTEFESGGATPLWKVLGGELIGERSGDPRKRADAVVVVRTVKPQPGDTARLLRGLFTSLAAGDIPAVGVEESDTLPSAVPVYHDRGLSSVDNIDQITGRAALALLLAGAPSGQYGTADGDDAVLPSRQSG
jgi:hypothetical protein